MTSYELNTAVAANISYQLQNPALYLSVLDVEPSVNSELIHAAKDRVDGMWFAFKRSVGRRLRPRYLVG